MESLNSAQIFVEMNKIESIVTKNEELSKDLEQLVQSLETSFAKEGPAPTVATTEQHALAKLQSAYNVSEERIQKLKQENYEYRLTLDLLTKAQENDKTSERTQLEINNLRQEIASREGQSRSLREEVGNLKRQMSQMTQALTEAVQEEQRRGLANAKRWGAMKEENKHLRVMLSRAEVGDQSPRS